LKEGLGVALSTSLIAVLFSKAITKTARYEKACIEAEEPKADEAKNCDEEQITERQPITHDCICEDTEINSQRQG